jgi:hypothetical protein
MNLVDWVKGKIVKRKIKLEDEIRQTYHDLTYIDMHKELTWDMYSQTQNKYIQALHLQRYGQYFKEGEIGANLPTPIGQLIELESIRKEKIR